MTEPNEETKENNMDHIDFLMFTVKDPNYQVHKPNDMPAMSTMLYRVCNNSGERFEEATRLLRLFMEKAYDEGYRDCTEGTDNKTLRPRGN